ncbi:MAG: hypothetical protein AB7N65_07260, partial [Vicinamibacterales bacterium]
MENLPCDQLRRLAREVLVFVMAIGIPQVLQAQPAPQEPPRLRLGTLRIEPAFALSTGENTNINKEGNSLDVRSFETVIIPHLDLRWE